MEKRVIALGFFDGVHLGHQALLERAMERAEQRGLRPALFTFDRSPREMVTGERVPLLTTPGEREALVKTLYPVEEVITAPFDQAMMTMPWQDFLTMLVERYHAAWLVAGHDFRFGYKNEGSAELLQSRCRELGLGCDIIPPVTVDGVIVSSTYIRSLLEQGDVEDARRFLGYPFYLTGEVSHGRGLGGQIGAPTLNFAPPAGHLTPKRGVYVTQAMVDGARCPAVTNVGVRPTVDEDGEEWVETHLLSNAPQLYGKKCRVEFLKFLRPERRFDSVEDLQAQISRDIDSARAYF
jgi:riboflavin kinase/FMN adenylyltransferase